jgi:hypothetical protein
MTATPFSSPVKCTYRNCINQQAINIKELFLVPGERIELPTNGLQNRCSTAELTRQIKGLGENDTGIATGLPRARFLRKLSSSGKQLRNVQQLTRPNPTHLRRLPREKSIVRDCESVNVKSPTKSSQAAENSLFVI